MCVFPLNSLPFPFLLHLFIHIFRKAGRAPEPVECSPVSDSRSRASVAWFDEFLGTDALMVEKQNNPHFFFCFFPSGGGVEGEGEFHFMSFFWFISWLLRGVTFDAMISWRQSRIQTPCLRL